MTSDNGVRSHADSRAVPIRAVLLDFGGVVAEEGFRAGLAEVAAQQGFDPRWLIGEAVDAIYDSGYVTGTGSEAAFWSLLRHRTGLRGDDRFLRDMILDRFRIRAWIPPLIHSLRQCGCIVGLLTDHTDWLDTLERRDGFLAMFDRVFNSYRLGKGKRDPSLFSDVTRALRLPPQQVLFVDDDAGHVERAAGRGLRAIRYTSRAGLERALRKLQPK